MDFRMVKEQVSEELDAYVKEEVKKHGYLMASDYMAKFYELCGMEDMAKRARGGKLGFTGMFYQKNDYIYYDGPEGSRRKTM